RHSIQPVTNAILLKLAPKILDLSSNQSRISCLRWMPPDTLKYLVVCQWPTCQHRQVIEDQVLKPSKSYATVRNAHLLVADIYLDSTVCHANHGRRIEAVPNAIVYRIDPCNQLLNVKWRDHEVIRAHLKIAKNGCDLRTCTNANDRQFACSWGYAH